ncbi:MAG: flagellar biosynthesis protein FliQ [Chloroflexota bacterium]
MNESYVLTLAQNALVMVALVAGPMLAASLAVGVIVSLFQAATQITEPTLTFVPKLVITGLVLAVLGSWMTQQLVTYTAALFGSLPGLAP